jgi:predicted transcriptional regulator
MEAQNPRRSFRLGDLGDRLDARAKRERVKPSQVLRRALAAYLDGSRQPLGSFEQIERFTADLAGLRSELARVGGNLNQLAHAFNMDEPLNTDELAVTHRELQTQFAALATLLKGVRDGIKSD